MEQTKRRVSQSLFLVEYFDSTPVSVQCSSAVVPWIIRELSYKHKNGASNSPSYWLAPGKESFSLVKEDGEAHFKYDYKEILRCSRCSENPRAFAVVMRERPSQRKLHECLVFLTQKREDVS